MFNGVFYPQVDAHSIFPLYERRPSHDGPLRPSKSWSLAKYMHLRGFSTGLGEENAWKWVHCYRGTWVGLLVLEGVGRCGCTTSFSWNYSSESVA